MRWVLLLFIQDPGGEADGSKFEGISLLYPLKIMKISRIVYNDQLILVCFMSGKLSVERRGGGGGGGGGGSEKNIAQWMRGTIIAGIPTHTPTPSYSLIIDWSLTASCNYALFNKRLKI